MRPWAVLAVLVAVVAGALLAEPASGGSGGSDGGSGLCEPGYDPILGRSCLRPDGLFDVVLRDGTRLQTHGPDPIVADGGVGFEEGSEERPLACAPDWRMHVLYGHPEGSANRIAQVAEPIRAALRRMNALLNAEGLESGGVTADYRAACDEAGEVRIDVFSTPYTSSAAYTDDFGQIVDGARAAGHKDARTDYLVFWDGGSTVCGVGNLAADDSLSPSNENLKGPDYGVVYDSCWFGRTPMHENGHTQGAVQDLAPDWDLTGHCLEGIDVMCYPTSDILVLCPDRTHFDCDHDTYFDAGPEAGEWLDTHWNLGSRINRYIAFDWTPPPPDANATLDAGNATANANATAPTPSATASRSSSPTRSPTPTATASRSTTPRSDRTVADAPASPSSYTGGPVTVTLPGPPAGAMAAALLGLAALSAVRRRL